MKHREKATLKIMTFRIAFLLFVVALLIVGCYLPWMTVESKALTITGMNATGTRFGKPGLFHLIWAALCLLFGAVPAAWSQRFFLIVAAFNLAWALRNFLFLPACQMGECPVRRVGLYVVLAASLLMFASLFLLRKNSTSSAN